MRPKRTEPRGWTGALAVLVPALAPVAFALAVVLLSASAWTGGAALAQSLPGTGSGGSSQESEGSSGGSGSSEPSKYWWEIDALNPSLPPPPAWLDRETPRTTLDAFMDAGARDDFAVAMHMMDFGGLFEEPTPGEARELARKLHEVMDRKVWIDWTGLPDRPDAVDVTAAGNSPFAGQPRKGLRIGFLEVEERPVSIWLFRVKPKDEAPVWIFAEQTVAMTEALHERFGPKEFEERLPAWSKRKGLFGLPLWELIGTPLILAVAVLAGVLAYKIVGVARRPFRKRPWMNHIVERARTPVALLVGAGLVWWLTSSLLTFSGPLDAILEPVLLTLIVVAVTLAVLRAIDVVLRVFTERYVSDVSEEANQESRRLLTNLSVVRRLIILVAFLVGAGALFIQLNLSETLGLSLLASAGVITLILGFAAQTVLGNILSSIQIAIAKPIRIGDAVFYEGAWGYIEEINYTYVLIRIWDERRFVVPVQYFVSHPFENWSIRNPGLIKPVELKLDYRTDVEELRRVFDEMLREEEDWDGEQEPKILVIAQDEEAMTVRFYLSAKDSSAAWDLHCRIREKILAHVSETAAKEALPRQRIVNLGKGGGQDEGDVDEAAEAAE